MAGYPHDDDFNEHLHRKDGVDEDVLDELQRLADSMTPAALVAWISEGLALLEQARRRRLN
jgi:hypothetical protein